MKKKIQKVPSPYNKWISLVTWKKISIEDRKILIDLIKLSNKLSKQFPIKQEEYINMNAEIEYLKSIGEH